MPPIRPARRDDVERMRAIERAAGEMFRPLGMDLVADDEPLPAAHIQKFVDDDRAWVAEVDGTVAGYLLAAVVDGEGHVEQVSVDPAFAGRRIGAALVEHAASRYGDLTLTTFRDVAWNGPYYERLGFRWSDDDEIGPELRAVREAERAHGLDRWPRGCMRRPSVPGATLAP
ncbi:GNAT family N-acetyltransferase [Pseudonocardia endophytica]|uniref:GNAT family N-acetyltransferase n=1 Tax=Pseudonocardia endophytica TaxID=401976 RepID=UPI003C70E93E